MKLSKEFNALLVSELKHTEALCRKTSTPEEMLYYFSSAFGIINRIMNFEFNPTLIFMHQVLQGAHQGFTNRMNTPRTVNTESFMGTPPEMFGKLLDYFSGMLAALEKGDDAGIYAALEKISVITYATTGNGFYLYITGTLKLD